MSNETNTFDEFYHQITPVLDRLEHRRLETVKKAKPKLKVAFVFLVLSTLNVIVFPSFFSSIKILFVPVFIIVNVYLFGSWYGTRAMLMKEIRPVFKKEVIQRLLEHFYSEVKFIPRQRIHIDVLRKSLLFDRNIRRHVGEDYTKCRIGNTIIQFSEVKAYQHHKDKCIFEGVFISGQFNKQFNSKTIVIPDTGGKYWKKIGLNWLDKMKNASIIKLEDPIFEKEFAVIGEDQIESRYKLSTSLMQRMLDYKRKVNKKISFSFIDNRLYVVIPNKVDLFEPNVAKPINEKPFIKTSYDYFELLTGLVEDLDLNTRIWV